MYFSIFITYNKTVPVKKSAKSCAILINRVICNVIIYISIIIVKSIVVIL